jgi:hypothetical protein
MAWPRLYVLHLRDIKQPFLPHTRVKSMAFPQIPSPTTSVLYHVKRVHMVAVKHNQGRNTRQHAFRASCIIGLALALVLSLLWFITTEAMSDTDAHEWAGGDHDATVREE